MLDKKIIKNYNKVFEEVRKELGKVVIGQEEVVNGVIRSLIANGHVLVEGIPGIAKTLIIKALAVISGCKSTRIQFTVDLLPTDIVGITTYDEKKGFYTVRGPIFSNFVIADEINRAPPKTQSALLEAMQERQATIGKETYPMLNPFFVMATQNPIESSGTYQLPQAQMDRFLFKILISYPKLEHEEKILNTNISLRKFEEYNLKSIITPKEILKLQNYNHQIFLSKELEKYIVKLVDATRNPDKYKLKLGKYIEWGCSPRASIGLFIASKADALMNGNNFVTPQNIKNVAYDVMRHRVLLNYEGQAEKVSTDDVVKEILSKVDVP
ncbi:MAG: MoxR family ATPase [Nanoarchaeota archaeon]|nr:MoxR family ATPase [Nanoarchaeota archaeon]